MSQENVEIVRRAIDGFVTAGYDLGRVDDIFEVAAETGREFGRVMGITKAAELLDLVDTPKQDIVLTAVGRRFVRAATGRSCWFLKFRTSPRILRPASRSYRWTPTARRRNRIGLPDSV